MIVNIQNSGPVGLDYTSHDEVVSGQLLLSSQVFSVITANNSVLRSRWRLIPTLTKVKIEESSLEMSKGSISRATILLTRRRARL